MKIKRNIKGFSLIELIVAMIVTSIIVTAVVTLAYALDTANDVSNETSIVQTQIRFASLRISDLIRHSKLICGINSDDMVVWRADDDSDGQISISELVYIECGTGQNHLQLYEFPSADNTAISISSIGTFASNWWTTYSATADSIGLIPECSNVQFDLDVAVPESKFVSISFDINENGISRQCQINATVRGWAGNLLDDSSSIVSDDD